MDLQRRGRGTGVGGAGGHPASGESQGSPRPAHTSVFSLQALTGRGALGLHPGSPETLPLRSACSAHDAPELLAASPHAPSAPSRALHAPLPDRPRQPAPHFSLVRPRGLVRAGGGGWDHDAEPDPGLPSCGPRRLRSVLGCKRPGGGGTRVCPIFSCPSSCLVPDGTGEGEQGRE